MKTAHPHIPPCASNTARSSSPNPAGRICSRNRTLSISRPRVARLSVSARTPLRRIAEKVATSSAHTSRRTAFSKPSRLRSSLSTEFTSPVAGSAECQQTASYSRTPRSSSSALRNTRSAPNPAPASSRSPSIACCAATPRAPRDPMCRKLTRTPTTRPCPARRIRPPPPGGPRPPSPHPPVALRPRRQPRRQPRRRTLRGRSRTPGAAPAEGSRPPCRYSQLRRLKMR